MIKLIENELIKIFKRKNIYIILIISIIMILSYNLFQKISNEKVDIIKQYERAYEQDKFYLGLHQNIDRKKYDDIIERIALEKYAIENNIKYNIFLNSENSNAPIPQDARNILMKIFDNFDIIFAIIFISISSTIISEEYNKGTIKNLLIKPHKKTTILCAKIITNIFLIIILSIFIVILQYIIGGIIFGFESYSLDAIIYNRTNQCINVIDLAYYILLVFFNNISLYILLISISLLLSSLTSNIAINILLSLGIYIIFNNLEYSPIILIFIAIIIGILSLIILNKKDIKNE